MNRTFRYRDIRTASIPPWVECFDTVIPARCPYVRTSFDTFKSRYLRHSFLHFYVSMCSWLHMNIHTLSHIQVLPTELVIVFAASYHHQSFLVTSKIFNPSPSEFARDFRPHCCLQNFLVTFKAFDWPPSKPTTTFGLMFFSKASLLPRKLPCYLESFLVTFRAFNQPHSELATTFRACDRLQSSLSSSELPCFLQSLRLTTFRVYDRLQSSLSSPDLPATSRACYISRSPYLHNLL